ncbi:MAG: hypothetical protein S4CHLAM45_11320 [Chlamydiales bacterium]|nr:hypothetical protein [Chlamydiales bacterium]MCH9619624.1 hypothetical protein [Chlamydiales bacterium]MCH9623230.1 hypothetical protein [Chlamydiales bacterium]
MPKKQAFTLLELMLVIALISLTLVGGGFGIARALKKERFEKRVEHVIGQITLAEETMIDTGQDVTLHIESASFNGGEAVLYFDGALGISPSGELILKEGEKKRVINLPGLPGKINQKEIPTHEPSYPKEIFSLT